MSKVVKLKTGVHQGSVLGPLLFIIYINDIPNSTDLFKLIIYADDTTVFTTFETLLYNTSNINLILNNELIKLCDWLNANKLSLNAGKTKAMIFQNVNKRLTMPNIMIENTKVDIIDDFNFLGITINKHLKWSSHIDKISHKISKTTGVLNKLKNYIPKNILLTIYQSLITPHLNYGVLAWGSSCGKVFKLQKKAIRIITNSKYNAHTEPLFKQLNILKVQDIFKLQQLKFYFKLRNNRLPTYFGNFQLTRHADLHSYETRGRGNFIDQGAKFNISKQNIRHSLPRLINACPHSITEKVLTHSLHGFSIYVKNYLIAKYESTCEIPDCYVCQTV